MAIADLATTTTRVQQQYDKFPYPVRQPAQEAERLLRPRLDELDRLNHYCFRGRRDFGHGFRVLVAGGGTGDSVVSLAYQLAETDAEIVYVDLSQATLAIAQQRARLRGLERRISWICGSLLDVPNFGLEPFDYINCAGVLHHLEDPAEGLAALVSVLKEDGALGLLLYGCYGRSGVYHVQQLMRLVNHDESCAQAMLRNTREILSALPETNWFKRSPAFSLGEADLQDAHFYDMFLHAKDRPFSVPEVYDLLDTANLHLVEFLEDSRALYDYRFAFRSERLQHEIAKLPRRRQQAAAELFWGNIHKHEFWASRRTDTVASPRDPDNVPTFSKLAELTGVRESVLTAVNDSKYQHWEPSAKAGWPPITVAVKLTLNEVNRRLIRLIDGRRSMGEIVEAIAGDACIALSPEEIWERCCQALESLRMFDYVLLRHRRVPAC